MMRTKLFGRLLFLIPGVLLGVSTVARAQNHIVTIGNGHVSIDGTRVPANDLPEGLNITNLSATMSFDGDKFLDLNGTVFQLLDGRLVRVETEDPSTMHATVFFADPSDNGAFVRMLSRQKNDFFFQDGSTNAYRIRLKDYYGELSDKAQVFDDLMVKFEGEQSPPTAELARTLKVEAENTARFVRTLPRVEYEVYLDELQESNYPLYGQLLREQDLELRTYKLAFAAQSAASRSERKERMEELRNQLSEIFVLKQKNREHEIEQLETRLQELKQQLAKRAKLKERIIEKRLTDLIESPR